jgi:SprB repeat
MRKSCIKATCFLIFVLVSQFNLKAQQIIFTTSNFASGFDISCHGATDGAVEAAVIWESPPYTFQWSNGAYSSQLNNITAGQYILTVTNAIAQTYTDTIDLLEPEPLDAFVYLSDYFGSNISGNGRSDGEIILETYGGAPEYSYLWSNSSLESRISNIPAGTYTVTITDGNECTKIISRTLIEPQVLQITGIVKSNYNGYNVSCKDNNDGWAEVNVIGGKTPYSYRWSNGQFAFRAVDLSSGSHQIEVTDANNIKVVANIVLTQPTSLFGGLTDPIGANGYHITCFQCANGSASTSATGGVTPYTYQWSNGATTPNVSGLAKGEYILTVTDKNGCTHQSEFEITEPLRENWTMTGNANTNASQEFIGTTDSTDFTFKTNSTERLKIGSNGKIKFPGYTSQFSQVMMIDPNGEMKTVDIPYVPCTGGVTFPWQQSIYDPTDVFSCWRRFGIGTDNPQVRLEVKGGLSRFTSGYSSLSYVEIGHDGGASGGGNAMINNVGEGSLMINYNIAKDVKICMGNSGDLEVGGNTFLATNPNKKVGIGFTIPTSKLEIQSEQNETGLVVNTIHNTSYGYGIISKVNDGSNSGLTKAFVVQNTFNGNENIIFYGSGFSNFKGDILVEKDDASFELKALNNTNSKLILGNPLLSWKLENNNSNGNLIFNRVDGTSNNTLLELKSSGEVEVNGTLSVNAQDANDVVLKLTDVSTGITNFKIFGDGEIYGREMTLTLNNFPDYVFDSNYQLLSLKDLKEFITINKHLPGVPSLEAVQKNENRVNIGDLQRILLEKIEELTLYVIQLEEKIQKLEK